MTRVVRTVAGDEVRLKTNFRLENALESLYSGGQVALSCAGEHIFCPCDERVRVVDTATGLVVATLESDTEPVTSIAVSPDGATVAVASRSMHIRLWRWKSNTVTHTWKPHDVPVSSMDFDPTSTLLATGSSNGSVKVFDVERGFCTHNFRGSQGIVCTVRFFPMARRLHLYTAADDCKVRVWSLQKKACIAILEGHVSPVRAIAFLGPSHVLTGGRDKVIHVWRTTADKKQQEQHEHTRIRTIPAFECIEGLCALPVGTTWSNTGDGTAPSTTTTTVTATSHFVSAGERGLVRVWDLSRGECVYTVPGTTDSVKSIMHLVPAPPPASKKEDTVAETETERAKPFAFLCADIEQGLTLYTAIPTLAADKYIVGDNDEIIDLRIVDPDSVSTASPATDTVARLVVATNTDQLRVFRLDNFSAEVLSGHTNTILSVDASGDGRLLATSSKDTTVRFWRYRKGRYVSGGVGLGHTDAVGAVALAVRSGAFAVSGSLDRTLKIWDVSEASVGKGKKVTARVTVIGHDKDINAVVVAPNDKVFASASQDRTAKVWRTDTGALVGVCRGHKRGVWSAQFSPVDQVLATASGDRTVRLWSLADFSCLKTFEGHANSVLKVVFVTRGMQLVSSGGDGLVKLWTVRTNECVATMDGHTEKVWAVAAGGDGDVVVSGGGDGVLNVWRDATQVDAAEANAAAEKQILMEQDLANVMRDKNYVRALQLAIELQQPRRALGIIRELLGETTDTRGLASVLTALDDDQLAAVLRFVRDWNTNSKHAAVAQQVLNVIARAIPAARLLGSPDIKALLEALLSYTDRHFQRAVGIVEQTYLIDYTWNVLRGGVVEDGVTKKRPLEEDTEKETEQKTVAETEKMTETEKVTETETEMEKEESQVVMSPSGRPKRKKTKKL